MAKRLTEAFKLYPIGTVLRNISEPKNKLVLLAFIDDKVACYSQNYWVFPYNKDLAHLPWPHELIREHYFWEVDEEATRNNLIEQEVKEWLND